jgi:hypothetical protein
MRRLLALAALAAVVLLSVVPSVGQARKALRANPPTPDTVAVRDTIAPYDVLAKRAVEATQGSSVHAIDTTLADARFDEWFRKAVGPDAKISWELNDCGESSGSPADSARDLPACVEVSADWGDGRTAAVSLLVGSERSGIDLPLGVFYAFAAQGDSTTNFNSLAGFSRFLSAAAPAPAPSPEKRRKR